MSTNELLKIALKMRAVRIVLAIVVCGVMLGWLGKTLIGMWAEAMQRLDTVQQKTELVAENVDGVKDVTQGVYTLQQDGFDILAQRIAELEAATRKCGCGVVELEDALRNAETMLLWFEQNQAKAQATQAAKEDLQRRREQQQTQQLQLDQSGRLIFK